MSDGAQPSASRVMSDKDMERAIARMSREILEANRGLDGLCLIGIRRGGVPLAARLGAELTRAEGGKVPSGVLDIGLYRDDVVRVRPEVFPTHIPFAIDDRSVVLVDDVLFTGRTVRAALDELMDFGRPKRVWLAALIDRGGRELPIRADFTGRTLAVSAGEKVEVRFREEGGEDAVMVVRR